MTAPASPRCWLADGKFAAAVKRDPQWTGIKAVKDGKVFVQPSLPFGWFDSPPVTG
jgi:iron complex transport system substrate-binding protein